MVGRAARWRREDADRVVVLSDARQAVTVVRGDERVVRGHFGGDPHAIHALHDLPRRHHRGAGVGVVARVLRGEADGLEVARHGVGEAAQLHQRLAEVQMELGGTGQLRDGATDERLAVLRLAALRRDHAEQVQGVGLVRERASTRRYAASARGGRPEVGGEAGLQDLGGFLGIHSRGECNAKGGRDEGTPEGPSQSKSGSTPSSPRSLPFLRDDNRAERPQDGVADRTSRSRIFPSY